MPIYAYKGIDRSGREIKATLNADSEQAAKHKIRAQGVMLVSLQLQKTKTQSRGVDFSGGKVSIDELSLMTRQLATLIKARIQIVEALSALVDQTEHQQLKLALSEIKQKVNEGSSLAGALADYPKIFNSVFINMVEAGEASGTLDVVLVRLAEFTESQSQLRNKVVGALTYPIIIAVIGFAMMMIIFVFVIPKLTKIFESQKRELPLSTKICIWISDIVQDYWYALIAALFFGYVGLQRWIHSPRGKKKWDAVLLKTPVIKRLIVMLDVSRFCSTLATLLNSGVPILVSMRIVTNLMVNTYIQKAVTVSRDHVSEGKSMTGPLVESGIFPAMVTHMIQLGERSGELQPMLKIVAENYEDQIDTQLNKITALLQPLMMVILGGLVFFIVISVVVPIMDLNQVRR